mgnify:CR=1 FL=1
MIDFDYSEWAILRFIGASFVLWLLLYYLVKLIKEEL